ncbi:hypothetical protein N9Z53_01240 [Mariniblastus sp.]|nr:hypothetical protein [Mariniblastus sp.]
MVKLRFNLKALLLVVSLCSLALACVSQVGVRVARFELIENNLLLNSEGFVQGKMSFQCTTNEYPDSNWMFECNVVNLPQSGILGFKPGAFKKLRYRSVALGPWGKEDPYSLFVTQGLKIQQSSIVGFVTYETGAEVMINGRQ